MNNGYIETMWAIHGDHGLYVGTALTRRGAITQHAEALHLVPHIISREDAWKRCKKKGDKAVKVEITYTA